jgi:V-type H+-transporting ATPase subunit H
MEEEYAVLGSLRVLALLIAYVKYHSQLKDSADDSTDPKPFPQNLVATLLASLQGLLNGTRQPLWEVAAQVLGAVLGSKQFRSAVWKEEHCISGSAPLSISRNRADLAV